MLIYKQRCRAPNKASTPGANVAHLRYIAQRPGASKNDQRDPPIVGQTGEMKAAGMIEKREQLLGLFTNMESQGIPIYRMDAEMTWDDAMNIELDVNSIAAWSDFAQKKVKQIARQIGVPVSELDYAMVPPHKPKEGTYQIHVWSKYGDLSSRVAQREALAGRRVEGSDDQYLRYLAERPGAVSNTPDEDVQQNEGKDFGLCGCLSGMMRWGEIDSLQSTEQYIQSLSEKGTPIYRGILSLREADALALGYDNRDAWMQYVYDNAKIWADGMNIPIDKLEWVANLHQEKRHPHIHIMFWEKDRGVKDYFVKPQVVGDMRRAMTRKMFHQQFEELYALRTDAIKQVRQEIKMDMATVNEDLTGLDAGEVERIQQELMGSGVVTQDTRLFSPRWAEKDVHWVGQRLIQLVSHPDFPQRGALKYGYMPPAIKAQIDSLVRDMLSSNAQCRQAWKSYLDTLEKIEGMYTESHEAVGAVVSKSETEAMRDLGNEVLKTVRKLKQQGVVNGSQAPDDSHVLPDGDMEPDSPWIDSEAQQGWEQQAFDFDNPAVQQPPNMPVGEPVRQPKDRGTSFGGAHPQKQKNKLRYHVSWGERYKAACAALDQREYEQAYILLLKEAKLGNVLAMEQVGKLLKQGKGVDVDPQAARHWLTEALIGLQAVDRAKPAAYLHYKIAKMYFAGDGCEKDPSKAAQWLHRAAGSGHELSMYTLAKLYWNGEGVEQDHLAAVDLYQKAADKGNSYAMFALGKIYRDGDHVAKDIGKAIVLFEKAAEQDNDSAAYALTKLYLQGEDVPQDIGKAMHWCKIAADHGHAFAQYTMGQLYAKGEEVPMDMHLALHYLKLSAAQENAYANAKLGTIYLFGKNGIEKDEAAGLDYLRQAAQQGSEFAHSVIDSYHNRYLMDVGNLAMQLFQGLFSTVHRKDQHLGAKFRLLMKQLMENKQARKEYALRQTDAGAMDWGDGM